MGTQVWLLRPKSMLRETLPRDAAHSVAVQLYLWAKQGVKEMYEGLLQTIGGIKSPSAVGTPACPRDAGPHC